MKTAIIDCRNFDQYQRSHHKHACHITAEQLFQRMHELPAKNTAIILYSDEQSITEARAFFDDKQYTLANAIIWSDAIQFELEASDLLETGSHSSQLWKASNIVDFFVENLLDRKGVSLSALDVGAGAGRDAVYLAKQGVEVSAIDYNPDALLRCKRLAANHHVNIDTFEINLEQSDNALDAFPVNSFDIIVVCRYLHRPLFTALKQLLKPRGYILYHTFMVGCERIGRPKNPNFLLKERELAEIFSDYNIINNDIEYLEDGRPTSFFIAQKKAATSATL